MQQERVNNDADEDENQFDADQAISAAGPKRLDGGHLKRNLDSIGGANLLKRNLDSIGGANLLKRSVDSLGGAYLLKRK